MSCRPHMLQLEDGLIAVVFHHERLSGDQGSHREQSFRFIRKDAGVNKPNRVQNKE